MPTPRAGPSISSGRYRSPGTAGLHRPRLAMVLEHLWTKRVCVVTAPPGSGKTTLLAGWARRCETPVAWYSADAADASRSSLLDHLHRSLAGALALEGPWESIEEAISALEGLGGPPVLLVVDDLHNLVGTEAESTMAQLLAGLPPTVRVLAATRATPSLNLSRLRLDDKLVELGADDLRFRTWETASLFNEHYACPLLPEEVSLLTRRTEGWAAGLQLFHLATWDKSAAERARMLAGFSAHSRLVADYLADNVIAGLPGDLVEFMIRTAALGVLSAALCDQLLDRSDGACMLAELERRQLFVTSVDDGATYRYHEVLRSYLDGRLVAKLGEPGAREWHYRAARLLRGAGVPEAALRALCRAEAWDEVAELRASLGEASLEVGLTGGLGGGFGGALAAATEASTFGWRAAPPRLVELDPWIGLTQARAHVAAGRLEAALTSYRRCEEGLTHQSAQICRAEMVAVAAWTNPVPSPAPGWTNALRRAMASAPLEAGGRAGKPDRAGATAAPAGGAPALAAPALAAPALRGLPNQSAASAYGPSAYGPSCDEGAALAGLCALLAGHVDRASVTLAEASLRVTSPGLSLVLRLGEVIARLLGTDDAAEAGAGARRALGIAGEAERLGVAWVARQAYAVLSLAGEADIAAQVSAQCHRESDPWGEVLAQLLEGAGRLLAGGAPVQVLTLAAGGARQLGAGTLEAWALACLALAEVRAENPQGHQLALTAEATARRAGVSGAQALAHLALGQAILARRALGDRSRLGRQAIENLRLARAMGEECGLGILGARRAARPTEAGGAGEGANGSPGGMAGAFHGAWDATRGAIPAGAADAGSDNPAIDSPPARGGAGPARCEKRGLTLQCFGGLTAWRDGVVVDLDALRPQARALLALLAMRYPHQAHCEVLSEALWPESDPRAGAHRLQTAISSLRRALAPHHAGSSASNPLVRRGEAYILQADGVDVADLATALRAASEARRAKDLHTELGALRRVLSIHRSELLPEFGPADWVVKEREDLRWAAADSAERIAELELATGHPSEALGAARMGLVLDRYRESLWRLATRAAETAGDQCLAARLRSSRSAALAELGLSC